MSLKQIVSAGAVLLSMRNIMQPDIAARAALDAAATVSGSLQQCKTQFNADNAFNYRTCITDVATQFEPQLDPDNLNGVMTFYMDHMTQYTENLLNTQEQLTLDAGGGIIQFLTDMTSKGRAALLYNAASALGLGFIAKNAFKGLMLVKKYLLGAVEQPVAELVATQELELVATQELEQATAQLLKIRRVANIVARAARTLITPILNTRREAARQEAARQKAEQQLNTSLGLVSFSSKHRTSATRNANQRATVAKSAIYGRTGVSKFPLHPIKEGGRKTKNKRNSRNSRNSRNKRNSRRK